MTQLFYFQENDMIFRIKQFIFVKTGDVPREQYLWFDGKKLDDLMTLSDCEIEHEDQIELTLIQSGC